MAEYIEREAANALLLEECSPKVAAYLIDAVAAIPAADVRSVVLCRDCKFWFNAPAADGFNSCELDALIRHENFFCAAGEKREGET